MGLSSYTFHNPWLLLTLVIIPMLAYWYYSRGVKSQSLMPLPGLGEITHRRSIKEVLSRCLPILKLLGLAGLLVALARPQLSLQEEEVKAEGIDIMMVMDLSSSMLAQDFTPDRISISKVMAQSFVDKRPYDRIGLVVFAGEAFTQCPLTVDHDIVDAFLGSLQCGLLEDGTAIGMGLATAVNRLKESKAKSKIVILLTDGSNNAGYIKPMTAADIAKEIGVKVYSIGVGSNGRARAPVSRRQDGSFVFGTTRVDIDETLLTEMSKQTGGQYFRATTSQQLEQIYAYIDTLEKTEIEVNVYKRYEEKYRGFLLFGLGCWLISWLLGHTLLRRLP